MIKKMLIIFGFLLFVASPAMALTYLDLMNDPDGITIDDKWFHNFTITGNHPPESIIVSELNDEHGIGLGFNSLWFSNSGIADDSTLNYIVDVVPGSNKLIHDIYARMTGGFTGDGAATVDENTVPGGNIHLELSEGVNISEIELSFDPTNTISVSKDIGVIGIPVGGDEGSASISFVRNQFSQVPEPSTLLLVGAGLVGIGFLRKKFKS